MRSSLVVLVIKPVPESVSDSRILVLPNVIMSDLKKEVDRCLHKTGGIVVGVQPRFRGPLTGAHKNSILRWG